MSYVRGLMDSRVSYVFAVFGVLLALLMLSVPPMYAEEAVNIKLTVEKSGDGTGIVGSSPMGISCGSMCSASYAKDTVVMLMAKPGQGSVFGGWSGCNSDSDTPASGTDDDVMQCKVKMSSEKTVTAKFNKGTPSAGATLDVKKEGDGTGMVMSTPPGISCGDTCSANYPPGTIVLLVAQPAAGSTFGTWSGCDQGTDTSSSGNEFPKCKVIMPASSDNTTANKTVTVKFNKGTSGGITLTVRKAGSGKGTVESTPTGISCGSTCVAPYAKDTVVTLKATADAASTFGGWSGCDQASDNSTGSDCKVTMAAGKMVTATFTGSGPVMPKVIHDYNGDGMSDILWHNQKTGMVAIWLMDSDNVTSHGSPGTVPRSWQIDGAGDFDGDGKTDIIWRNTKDGSLHIWFMDGLTMAGRAPVKFSNSDMKIHKKDWYLVAVGDFNGDGKTDMLFRQKGNGNNQHGKNNGNEQKGNGKMALWLMNGADVVDAKVLDGSPGRDWVVAGVGDFDGDGRDDIIFRHEGIGKLAIWLMDGTTARASMVQLPLKDPQWRIARVGDFDGDGKADILYKNVRTGDVAIWFMDGTTVKDAKIVATVADDSWHIVRVGDYNGDGKLDILWQNDTTGLLYMWFMDGATIKSHASLGAVDDPDWFVIGTGRVQVTPANTTLTAPAVNDTTTFTVDGGEAPYTTKVSNPALISAAIDADGVLTVTVLKAVTAEVRAVITVLDANNETAWAFVTLKP
ncbi:MAG: VCBS repeat-containing protein [Nitrospirae bacterium]|nr:VCBS repeat-containing protein [Nitrospirota bacterium]